MCVYTIGNRYRFFPSVAQRASYPYAVFGFELKFYVPLDTK